MNLLEIHELRVSFRDFNPVRGVSLAVKEGEFVALVGNSGSGKSTLALAILKLQDGVKISGRILFRRQDIVPLGEPAMRRLRGGKIAMIFQEPMNSLNPLHTAGRQVLEALALHTADARAEQVRELFRLVELDDPRRIFHSYPHQLSGGQRQRVMIAMALAGKPELLIADEPTTALDVSVQAQILRLLRTLQQKLNLSILFITHDLEIVRRLAQRVYVMKGGKIISTRVPEETALLERPAPAAAPPAPVLDVRGLGVSYGRFQAVKDVSFCLKSGRTLGIVGESGSGKSSLARGLVRLVPAAGEMLLGGTDFLKLSGRRLRAARAHIQMVFQDPVSSLNPRMTVADIIAEGICGCPRAERRRRVAESLKAVGLKEEVLGRYPHALSGGQRTKVALARVLIMKPRVLILDEVTAALDIYAQRQLLALLLDLQAQFNLSYLFISHDMRVVRQMADDVIVMKDGAVVEQGGMEQVFRQPRHPYTQKLLAAVQGVI